MTATDLTARREALAARLAQLPRRSHAAIRLSVELGWVTNDLLRLG